MVPVEDLQIFLQSKGRSLPAELVSKDLGPRFRSPLQCWEFWQASGEGSNCQDCIVRKNTIQDCFIAKICRTGNCERSCRECRYYDEVYLPRIQFIHQIDEPAAVWKDFCFWGGNAGFAQLCEVGVKDLIGMGLEEVIHPDSLKTGIAFGKRMMLGDPQAPRLFSVFLKGSSGRRTKARISHFVLNQPPAATLMIACPI